jgi:fermentation-respiration switch protein FrsA (DUF1100 family)
MKGAFVSRVRRVCTILTDRTACSCHSSNGPTLLPPATGIIRWTGKVAPNQISPAVVATYDIFSTLLALAGVDAPTDRVIDGRDLSPMLFHHTTADGVVPPASTVRPTSEVHDCLFHYKGAGDWGSAKPGALPLFDSSTDFSGCQLTLNDE